MCIGENDGTAAARLRRARSRRVRCEPLRRFHSNNPAEWMLRGFCWTLYCVPALRPPRFVARKGSPLARRPHIRAGADTRRRAAQRG